MLIIFHLCHTEESEIFIIIVGTPPPLPPHPQTLYSPPGGGIEIYSSPSQFPLNHYIVVCICWKALLHPKDKAKFMDQVVIFATYCWMDGPID